MLTVGKIRTLLSSELLVLKAQSRNATVAFASYDFSFLFMLDIEQDHFIGLISDKSDPTHELTVPDFLHAISFFTDKTPVRSECGQELRIICENSFDNYVCYNIEVDDFSDEEC